MGALILSFLVPAVAFGQGQPLRTRHVRSVVSNGTRAWAGQLPASRIMRLSIVLPLSNESELDQVLQALYDPTSPSYHQFLSMKEFTDRFGPSQQQYKAVIKFAKANGLKVTTTYPNRLVVNVSGTVANIEKALNVSMCVYQHKTKKGTFFATDREPTPALPFALWHIAGLDNYSTPHPASLKRASDGQTPNRWGSGATGSGPGGYYIGSDMRAAYYGGTSLTGKGQSVGLVEFAGYNAQDISNYFNQVNQKCAVPIKGVSVDGSSLNCTRRCDDTEQALDIEEAISMAPGMSQLRVYVSDTNDVAIFNKMATENICKSLSCSWGWSPADTTSNDPIFKEFAAQGQTLFVASGDSGAYNNGSSDVYPADDPYVTSVGGTDLITAGAGGAWQSETAWSDSGGGISPNKIAIPSYQRTTGIITTANGGSTAYRNCPDVAAQANTNNYICYDGFCEGGWGGTSFAAPIWAGYLALANQQAASSGYNTLGFINPSLYTIGLGKSYTSNVPDITSGSNGAYSSTTGYDLVTGWGSPKGSGLILSLEPWTGQSAH
ncbi:MAG: S53 family peptidase [Syntrophobacteraceae bacterium]|nr:S53 family peptidase [Syntrophobacteraceae bacterium]